MTATEIINRALRRAGVGQTLTDYTSDTGEPAEVARDFYDTVRDEVCVYAPWSFCSRRAALAITGTPPDEDEWTYQYVYPSDCLRPLWLVTGLRSPRPEHEIEYRIFHDGTSRRILTDEEDAVLEYVAETTDTAVFSPDFADALAYRLAAEFAATLQQNTKKSREMFAMYQLRIGEAYTRDADARRLRGPAVMSTLEASREEGDTFHDPYPGIWR